VTVANACGSSADVVVVEDEYCGCNVWVPNAFTPDGDGVNDTFGAEGSSIGQFEMRIWNRWGDEIWSTNSLEGRWDGTGDRRAKHGESEVYVFSITYTTLLDADGQESFPQEKRGFVTVVR
jgi:gliding motility-associated-like protein